MARDFALAFEALALPTWGKKALVATLHGKSKSPRKSRTKCTVLYYPRHRKRESIAAAEYNLPVHRHVSPKSMSLEDGVLDTSTSSEMQIHVSVVEHVDPSWTAMVSISDIAISSYRDGTSRWHQSRDTIANPCQHVFARKSKRYQRPSHHARNQPHRSPQDLKGTEDGMFHP